MLVLSLCDYSGVWSRPYEEAGYLVVRVDLKHGQDVRLFEMPSQKIHGILAAPPCTYFCRMRMCRGKPTDEEFIQALSVVDACLRLVAICKPSWWCLENPQGYLKRWLGEPRMKFDPCDFGDPWTKRTWLWGDFTIPQPQFVAPVDSWVRKHADSGPRKQTGIARTAVERSTTPAGFSQAFFEANP